MPSKRLLYRTLRRSLSLFFFSVTNDALGNACRWYRLSARQRENVPRGTYEFSRFAEDADRSGETALKAVNSARRIARYHLAVAPAAREEKERAREV